jgi:hypothetical protein
MVIGCRVEGSFFILGVGIVFSPLYTSIYIYVMWAITRVQVILSSIYSLNSFCGVVNS